MGSKSPQKVKAGPAEANQMQFLQGQQSIGAPVQAGLIGAGMGGATSALSTSLSPAKRDLLARQNTSAVNDIMNSGVRGGQLRKRLGDQRTAYGMGVGQAEADAMTRGEQNSLGLLGPWAAPGMGMFNAQQNLTGTESSRNQANVSAANQASQAKGAGTGQLLGSGMGALAIAGMF